jgi:hypothetical protein
MRILLQRLATALGILVLAVASQAAAQEASVIPPIAAETTVAPSGGFRIRSVRFEIKGRTRERFLLEAAEIEIGRGFADRASLDAYLADRAQLLVNKRTIESAIIEPDRIDVGTDGVAEVDLVARVEDTVNIIALPYFKYDSNDGLLLSARGRDYNFFGSMQPFKLDFNYTVDTGGNQEWEVETESDLPFRMGGLDYEWSLDQSFGYTDDAIFRYEGVTSLDLILPLWGGKIRIGPSQGLYIRPDNDDGSIFDGWYFKSVMAAKYYDIPLPVDLGYFGTLKANIYVGITHYWNTWGPELLPERYGPILMFSQSAYFSRIDWLGNFRRGLEATATFSENYNLDTLTWDPTISASVIGHYKIGPRLGVSGKLRAVYYLDGPESDIGDDVRGILDSRIDTDAAIFLNLEMPFAVYRYMPHEWTGVSWLRFIALEQHWAPFFDMALTHDGETGRWFDPRDGWYGAGLEVITFPYKFRSFYVRVSAGWDIPTLIETKSLSGRSSRDGKKGRELYIGLGHQF